MKGSTLEKPALNDGVERNCPKRENGSKEVGGLGTRTAAPGESREGGRERLTSRSAYQAGTLCYTPVIATQPKYVDGGGKKRTGLGLAWTTQRDPILKKKKSGWE